MMYKLTNLDVVCWFRRLVEEGLDWYRVGQAGQDRLKTGTMVVG